MRSWIDERDNLESSVLKETINEISERDHLRQARLMKGTKVPTRKRNQDERGGSLKMLFDHGLDPLVDLVSVQDLENMKPDIDLPGTHNRERHAKLLDSLHKLNEQNPRVQNSFQFLAHVDTVNDIKDGTGEWQVQISRSRRRRHERNSKDDEAPTGAVEEANDKPLTDAHGNEILPMLEAAKRVATSKEIKRVQKTVRRRRRSGEECFTDDELESANLTKPPEPDPAERRAAEKLIRCAAVDLALESDVEGTRSCEAPTAADLCDWMGLDSLKNYSAKQIKKELAHGFVVPIAGYQSLSSGSPSTETTGSHEGYVWVTQKERSSSLC